MEQSADSANSVKGAYKVKQIDTRNNGSMRSEYINVIFRRWGESVCLAEY